jgi:hypothetical protein
VLLPIKINEQKGFKVQEKSKLKTLDIATTLVIKEKKVGIISKQ